MYAVLFFLCFLIFSGTYLFKKNLYEKYKVFLVFMIAIFGFLYTYTKYSHVYEESHVLYFVYLLAGFAAFLGIRKGGD